VNEIRSVSQAKPERRDATHKMRTAHSFASRPTVVSSGRPNVQAQRRKGMYPRLGPAIRWTLRCTSWIKKALLTFKDKKGNASGSTIARAFVEAIDRSFNHRKARGDDTYVCNMFQSSSGPAEPFDLRQVIGS
jgi:hypothetical protein